MDGWMDGWMDNVCNSCRCIMWARTSSCRRHENIPMLYIKCMYLCMYLCMYVCLCVHICFKNAHCSWGFFSGKASLLVADANVSFEITGLGDVLEPKDGVIAIGSGGTYALGRERERRR